MQTLPVSALPGFVRAWEREPARRPRCLNGCQARLATFQPRSHTQQVPADWPRVASAPRGSRGRSPEPGSQVSALGPGSGRNLSRPTPLWGAWRPPGYHRGHWRARELEGDAWRQQKGTRTQEASQGTRRSVCPRIAALVCLWPQPRLLVGSKLPGAAAAGPPTTLRVALPTAIPPFRKLRADEQTHK